MQGPPVRPSSPSCDRAGGTHGVDRAHADPPYDGLFGSDGQALKDSIDSQKDFATVVWNRLWERRQWLQVSAIVLGSLATAVAAVGNRVARMAPWVIVPTAGRR